MRIADSIQAVCTSNCALRAGGTDSPRKSSYRPRFSERDPQELGPHALLERRAGRHKRQRDPRSFPEKSPVQFVAQSIEMRRFAWDDGTVESSTNGLDLRRQPEAIGEFEQADPLRRGCGHQRSGGLSIQVLTTPSMDIDARR